MIVCQQYVRADDGVIDALLLQWKERWPRMGVLALLPEAEAGFVPVLQRQGRERAIPMVGAIFPALVANDGFRATGLWLICFDRMPAYFLASDLDVGDPQPLASAVQGALGKDDRESPPVAFLVFDGMLPNVSSLLHGLYELIGSSVRYSGVCAGSETFQPMPCLFDTDRHIGNGILGILFDEEIESVVLRHDYPVAQTLMRATSTEGNRIERIDGRPAFSVYQEVIRHEFGIELTHDNFYDYAVHFPFGLITAVDVLVRIPVAYDGEGSLWCVGEVPPNSLLRLLRAPPAENSPCIASLVAALGKGKHAERGHPLLTFYCAGRRMHLGAGAVGEISQLVDASGAPAVFGALSLGEVDQSQHLHIPRFHNAALVCLGLASGRAVED